MAEKRTTPDATPDAPDDAQHEAPAGARRKKRVAPTIDLAATEMTSASAPEPPASEPEPPQQSEKDNVSGGQGGARAALVAVAAGLAGGALVILVLCGLWFAGWVPVRNAGPAIVNTQSQAKSLDALAQRVSKVEDALAKLPAGDQAMAERLTAADNAMKSLGIALAALNRRSDDIAANAAQAREAADAATKAVTDLRASMKASGPSSADVEALDKRIAALESASQQARADIGNIANKRSGNDRAARLALSAEALREAALTGAPFVDELAAVRHLGGDAKALMPLALFATTGVPGDKTLARELASIIPAMVKNAGAQAPQGGFLDRLEANAGKLVRIRPVNAPAGDDPPAVLARIEIDAANNNVTAALADLGKLSDAVRAPAQAWIKRANDRQAALAAAHKVAADAARLLAAKDDAQ